jgi:5-(carboxyamino)imidazole ribonucleotide synthase
MIQTIGSSFSFGILGAGQLGKMLAQAASPWDLKLRMLDPSDPAPAEHLCETFVRGDFRDYQTVLDFGRGCDVLTIEIEQVNADALVQLESEGVRVFPQPGPLKIIQDKGLQKQFFVEHGLPTSPFKLYDNADAVRAAAPPLPCVQKTRTDGYDGRGVKMLRRPEDFKSLVPGACLIEDAVDVDMELAVIAARSPSGEIKTYDPVEMSFHPEANLVEFLAAPARISTELAREARALAEATIEAFQLTGLLAVEMFLNRSGTLLINEVAPRPHNSGHHTIEACVTSQYQQHLRAILNLPLGDTSLRAPAVMLNVLGSEGFSGPVHYEGVEHILSASSAYLHLYGKKETRPFRKMGHMTVLGDTLDDAITKARSLQPLLKVKSI